jgi:hypothetical protein
MKSSIYENRSMGIVLAGLALLGACSSDPVFLDEHGEEIEGVELVLNGEVLASYDGDERAWTGELTVDQGQETGLIEVRFTDHHGDEVALEDDVYLEVEIEEETIAEFIQDTPGAFEARLRGLLAGETTAVVRLMHGAVGSGHPDLEATELPIRVN